MPSRRTIRVVLDANWFISACLSRKSRRTVYYHVLRNKRIRAYYSPELIDEFDGVMSRPKFAKYIAPAQVARFRVLALLFMTKVTPAAIPATSRDAKDDYLLGICKASNADFLITGDDDLLTLGTFEQTVILSMGQFLQTLSLLE
ncbi:hypothetical protein FAES_0076 [Fibrella aestuarina BUZ 2]|uniref:PIN domain-containing protein n=1 Tax=Fibrella aestuarina BUZ 2 TaxID=1166018 RepID=I0K1T7_9BACT|nr:putative toxin-antitoxin system toxin component, PIN family [Fibrella aestuarina]CCG98090.1 hypothetical protein FAES_0076 [Fibrella aestuarina BUZ 2]